MSPLTVSPPEETLREEAQHLSDMLHRPRPVAGQAYLVAPSGERLPLPEPIFEVLVSVADALRRGDGVTLMPLHRLLTTNEAAEVLNISRTYLVRLLDQGELPYERVGTHRRLQLRDVLAYRDRRAEQRRAALERMVRAGEEGNLPY